MDEPLVSVIIPTKNNERTIDRCLFTIKNQSYNNIELIVVDNHSTDKTLEIAKKYANKIYTKGPERSAQRNFGAKKAKGKYLLIHDSDIYFHKDSVKECVELAEKRNCKAIILPEKSIGEGYWTKVKAFERSFYVGNDLIEAARFFDRKTYLEIGGYDEELTACEDWDLTIRFRQNKHPILRTKLFLLHDEGKLNLFGSSKKKSYYSIWIQKYKLKHPVISKKQFNFFKRFSFFKLIFNGLIHPILSVSMIVMKFLEFFKTRGS